MKAGLIAAGEGSRMRASHPGTPKPLIPVAGAPLVHWVIGSLTRAGISDFTMLHNSRGRGVAPSLTAAFPQAAWRFLEKDTPSSWESFKLVAGALASEPEFLISTIDALVAPADISLFIEASRKSACDAALGLTSFVDDEKPLWAELGEGGRIAALGPSAKGLRLATSGLYYLRRPLARRLKTAGGFKRLRDFWISETRRGTHLLGIVLSKTLDVDRPEDLREAELFIKETSLKGSLA